MKKINNCYNNVLKKKKDLNNTKNVRINVLKMLVDWLMVHVSSFLCKSEKTIILKIA